MIKIQDVKVHAPKVYILIKRYYSRVDHLIGFLGDDINIREVVEANTNFFGILHNPHIKYEETLLDNDDFKMAVILHLAISKLIGEFLDWETFLVYKNILYKSCLSINNEPLGVNTIILKKFNVDPAALSSSFRIMNNKVDEFVSAVEIIVKELKLISFYNLKEFNNYNDYFDYVKEKALIIQNDLHKKGYFGTKEIESFTCSCIAHKMRLPTIDLLYKSESMESDFKMPVESVKEMQEQILNKIFEDE